MSVIAIFQQLFRLIRIDPGVSHSKGILTVVAMLAQ